MRKCFCYGVRLLLMFLIVTSLTPTTMGAQTNGLIIMITDFGFKDFYVGAMKGAMYKVFPQAKIDEISHGVSKFDIKEGAYTLAKAAPEFPTGTVFVGVIDPGVGTQRKPIAMKTKNGNYFVAPDNGLLTLIDGSMGVAEVREITNRDVMRQDVQSSTFHGRDIFGPAAAHLAKGFAFEKIGPVLKEYVQLPISFAKIVDDTIVGQIDVIDEYGNVITNIRPDLFEGLGIQGDQTLEIEFNHQRKIRCKYVKAYGDVPVGSGVGLFGSGGVFEVAINQGNLAEDLKLEATGKCIVRKESD
jgi:S-adenosylmethionine hydrolase